MPAPHSLPHTRVPAVALPTAADAARFVAAEIATLIRARNADGRPTVLGLATGSTPVSLYRELIRLHRIDGLDFSRVVTFNLDEYFPMTRADGQSYHRFMREMLFDHVNIPAENIHIPDGELPADQVDEFCADYERKIKAAGGIDVQILGIGRTGHIGFNEPGSPRTSRTRMVTLDGITRRDAAAGFFGEEFVPSLALTMGVATILDARRVVLMAFGEHKAGVVARAVEQPPTEAVTASFLQEHPNALVVLDAAAAAELTAVQRPWEVGPCRWTPALVRRAVVHLSVTAGKGLQMLRDDDFRDHHLFDLLREQGPAERIGEAVFHDRLDTIKPYPAGRTAQTILVFSPHPDDDVISMGGTIIRLVEQGHRVYVAYMTSGNIAVFDHDARRFVDFVGEFVGSFGDDREKAEVSTLQGRVFGFLDAKAAGGADSPEVLTIKTLIRATEARAAARVCGVMPDRLRFMNLRFYRTGTVTKNPVQPEDIADIIDLLDELKPAQVYVAGEMSDPHGTHRLCAEAIFKALRRRALRDAGAAAAADPAAPTPGPVSGLTDPAVWLYRGAWEEWAAHEVEMAVPVSFDVLERKKQAIFRHQSQKDRAMFPGGTDRREFWQRAEDRNRGTAAVYDALGLPEYYALEAFVRWPG